MNQLIEPIRIELSLGIMFQSVNCYLIPGEKLTLIDCGLDSEQNWIDFQKKIKSSGYNVSDIEQIIITHEHRDHIGLLSKIMEESKAIVRAPKQIEKWFSHPEEMKENYLRFIKKQFPRLGFPAKILMQTFQFVEQMRTYHKFDISDRFEFFKEGDFLHFGNTKWEALNTPGHCPSQFIFLQKEQKRIISGDMLLPIAPMPIVTENPKKAGQPIRALKDLINSFDRLRKFNLEKIYPGHGPIFNDANKLIDKQLARMDFRKNECFEAIKSSLKTPYEINRKMYPYQNMPPDFSGMYMILGYLDLLEEEGKIRNTGHAEKTFHYEIKD